MGRSELQDVKQQFKRFFAEAPDFDVLDIERASEPAPAIEHDFTFVTRDSETLTASGARLLDSWRH